jgi:hypothetical protein
MDWWSFTMIEEFSPFVQEHIGWYVYLLRDPRNSEVFYVGKGKGNRVFAHARDAVALPDSEKPKLDRIREIHETGRQVQAEIIRHNISTERAAYDIEASVLDTFRALGHPLLNEVAGHRVALYGWATAEVVASVYEAEPFPSTDLPLVFLKLSQLWTPAMSADEMYDATRGWWTVGPASQRARYAIAVSKGVSRAVYSIDYWRQRVPGDRDYSPTDNGKRWGFHGHPESDLAGMLNRSTKHLKQASGASFFYLNCGTDAPDAAPRYSGEDAMNLAESEQH